MPATAGLRPHASLPSIWPAEPLLLSPERLVQAPVTFMVCVDHCTMRPTLRTAVVVSLPRILLVESMPVDLTKNRAGIVSLVPCCGRTIRATTTALAPAITRFTLSCPDCAALGSGRHTDPDRAHKLSREMRKR